MEGTNFYTKMAQQAANHYSAFVDESGKVLSGKFDTVATPDTTANVFQKGCIMIKTDAGNGTAAAYQNTGTLAAPVWTLMDVAGAGGITELTGDVTAGPGSGSVVTSIAAGAIVNADINASAAIAFSKLEPMVSGTIIVGSAGTVATEVAMSGDATIIASGAVTVSGVNGFPVNTAGIQNTAQTFNATFMPLGAPEAQSGAGALDPSSYQTQFTSAGTGDALTLADGTIRGQLKKVTYVAEAAGGDTGVITPATPLGYATVTLNAIGDYVVFMWLNGLGWRIVDSVGVTVA